MRSKAILVLGVLLSALVFAAPAAAPGPQDPLRFRLSFPSSARDHPATGRVFVLVSKSNNPEPRFQTDIAFQGIPFWGRDVAHLRPGEHVSVGLQPSVYGYPLASIARLPAGTYYVQAFLNTYTTFHRSDGSIVQLHMPCGDGGYFFDSPGNLYSPVRKVHLDPSSSGRVSLQMSRVIPEPHVPPGGTCQQGNPPDSPHVKHVKIKSSVLTRFWGRPIYIGANVLLPRGYDRHAKTRYPVVWEQTHFPFGNPFGFQEQGSDPFSSWWRSWAAPKVIIVDIRTENPYFDDSYAVNSANLGPYGDAVAKELVPYLDRHFKTIAKPYARVLTGGSTGGWEALAQQVFYPSLYGGAWVFYPDPVDFHFFQLVDIYNDPNAYVHRYDWVDVPRPSARFVSGDTLWTMEEENHWELALGTHGRSQLGQWDIWQAVYGPQGPDGYPVPIWNKRTGKINHRVAARWRSKDVRYYLAHHWRAVGPELAGKLRFFVGDADTFFLNDAVELLKKFLDGVRQPESGARFTFGRNQPHGWSPYSRRQLIQIMATYIANHAPKGANTTAWLGSAAHGTVIPGNYRLGGGSPRDRAAR